MNKLIVNVNDSHRFYNKEAHPLCDLLKDPRLSLLIS